MAGSHLAGESSDCKNGAFGPGGMNVAAQQLFVVR